MFFNKKNFLCLALFLAFKFIFLLGIAWTNPNPENLFALKIDICADSPTKKNELSEIRNLFANSLQERLIRYFQYTRILDPPNNETQLARSRRTGNCELDETRDSGEKCAQIFCLAMVFRWLPEANQVQINWKRISSFAKWELPLNCISSNSHCFPVGREDLTTSIATISRRGTQEKLAKNITQTLAIPPVPSLFVHCIWDSTRSENEEIKIWGKSHKRFAFELDQGENKFHTVGDHEMDYLVWANRDNSPCADDDRPHDKLLVAVKQKNTNIIPPRYILIVKIDNNNNVMSFTYQVFDYTECVEEDQLCESLYPKPDLGSSSRWRFGENITNYHLKNLAKDLNEAWPKEYDQIE